ncbi:MAG: rRNA pseudouridine synthase [Clostridia bacterium]|nr:rRNA pseudouridine synthase [Clostridia bacterium]
MQEMRLQKYLAQCGLASRRKAEELIKQGRVSVNGIKVSEMGLKISERDIVLVDGKKTALEAKKIYIMLNKPCGYITSAKDQFSRKTVLDLVEGVEERVYPVGRLDYDTSGLLILTNDGEFTNRMTHPRHETNKVYIAEVKGRPDSQDLSSFEKGLSIDNYITAPAKIKIMEKKADSTVAEIIIHEGRNRQIRKMCSAIGHPVISLKRIAIGGLKLGELPEGQWRYLTDAEIDLLRTH